jgi:hypothetical protein
MSLYAECVGTLARTPLQKSTLAGGKFPKVGKPLSPQAEKIEPDSPKPKRCARLPWCRRCSDFSNPCRSGSGPCGRLLSAGTNRVPQNVSPKPLVSWTQSHRWIMVKARLRHSLRRFRDSVHGSQSPFGTTQILSRLDFISVDL